MSRNEQALWERFQRYYTWFPEIGLGVDLSRMTFDEAWLESMEPHLKRAFEEMEALEQGAIANPDENRMVGHYWLRAPEKAPRKEIQQEIETTAQAILELAAQVHQGKLKGAGGRFQYLLLIGIGGSALGPQFVAQALGDPKSDELRPYFLDNTDPDGIDRTLGQLKGRLGETLCLVVSKSGGTKETRNGMVEAQRAYAVEGVDFAKHAIAITQDGSELSELARKEGWLRQFPMWDWVGGRTSETSAVGLLPAALQGLDIKGLLEGARACDEVTRQKGFARNPAAQLALMWHYAGRGKGEKAMVTLPYKDRLEWLSRYLQQLVMESLGKAYDLEGNEVHQGLTVYGNKGSTDQHAFIQQLREGPADFFVTFIHVLRDRAAPEVWVESDVTAGDYLHGFLLGTREALYENGRESISLTIEEVSSFSIGMLIALYERAVGFYASLIRINAYHQPGVEAGKKAASAILSLQQKVLETLRTYPGQELTVEQIGKEIGSPQDAEKIYKICEHLAANPSRKVERGAGESPSEVRFRIAERN